MMLWCQSLKIVNTKQIKSPARTSSSINWVALHFCSKQCYKYRRYIGNIAMLTHWRYIGNISPRYFPDFFWRFFPILSRYLPILSRYLPIFSNILWFFFFFVFFNIFEFFILPIYCRCLPTFSPINPIISFWTLGDIFTITIFVTLIYTLKADLKYNKNNNRQ